MIIDQNLANFKMLRFKRSSIMTDQLVKVENCCKDTCCADGCCTDGCNSGNCSSTCCADGCCSEKDNCCEN